jgi:hypothetical protein
MGRAPAGPRAAGCTATGRTADDSDMRLREAVKETQSASTTLQARAANALAADARCTAPHVHALLSNAHAGHLESGQLPSNGGSEAGT